MANVELSEAHSGLRVANFRPETPERSLSGLTAYAGKETVVSGKVFSKAKSGISAFVIVLALFCTCRALSDLTVLSSDRVWWYRKCSLLVIGCY